MVVKGVLRDEIDFFHHIYRYVGKLFVKTRQSGADYAVAKHDRNRNV